MLERKNKGEMIWYKQQFWNENIFSYEALIVLQLANTIDTVVKNQGHKTESVICYLLPIT